MFITALKGVAAHRARLLMTALAIVIGVAFVSGTFVFADTTVTRTIHTAVFHSRLNTDQPNRLFVRKASGIPSPWHLYSL